MVSVRRRVLRRLPHDHDTHNEQEVIHAPDAIVDATLNPLSWPLQPLISPHVVSIVVHHDVAEQNQRERRHHHAHHQQIAQSREDVQLRRLLLLRQLVHRVHQALEDPEIHQRVHSTAHPTHSALPRRDQQTNHVRIGVVRRVHIAV